MFGNQNSQATPAVAIAVNSGPLTLEQILGLNMQEARLIEGGTWPMGMFAWQISDLTLKTYTIKAENHPNLGKDAPMLTIELTCINSAAPTLRGTDGKPVTEEEAASWIGKKYKENIMFGNDGLPNKHGVIEHRGMNMTATLFTKMLGAENYAQLCQGTNFQLGAMIDTVKASGHQFVCELSHNTNPNDPNKRVNSQINLFGTFGPVA